MICVLNVFRGPARQGRYVLREHQRVEIGRSSSADISLPADTHLSRKHLEIDSKDGDFLLCDLGSANGTYVNDERVNRAILKTGDVIRIGKTHLRVSVIDNATNPHAEDGVQFTVPPSVESNPATSHPAPSDVGESDIGAGERPARTISFPEDLASEDRTRIGPVEELSPDQWLSSSQAGEGVPDRTRFLESTSSDVNEKDHLIRGLLNDYFRPSQQRYLYEQIQPLESAWGDFAGMVGRLSERGWLLLVINTSQMSDDGSRWLQKKLDKQQVVPLSSTLVAGIFAISDAELAQLSNGAGRDGVICIGSDRRIDPDDLKPFANSLSYPSMFAEYLRDPDSPVTRFLRKRRAWALFEWSSTGPIGLFSTTDYATA